MTDIDRFRAYAWAEAIERSRRTGECAVESGLVETFADCHCSECHNMQQVADAE